MIIHDDLFRKLPVLHIGDYKLHLVLFLPKSIQVWPVISRRFTGCRALNVENDRSAVIDVLRRNISAGFDQYFIAAIAKFGDKWKHIFLCERLAACNLDQIAAELFQL